MELIIGSHVSYKKGDQLVGSIKEALDYNSNAFMFYTGAPQNTKRSDIDFELNKLALKALAEANIKREHVIIHAPYIVNPANIDNKDFAVSFLKKELKRVEMLGFKYIVLHPGSSLKQERQDAIGNVISVINSALEGSKVTVLLETMAGKGTEIGKTFAEIAQIIDGIKYKDKIGVCIDTCHLNDSGYDLSNFDAVLDEFDEIVGIKYIKCVHLNDSMNELGAGKDRHANIGFGTIGFDNLINVAYNKRLAHVPKILETPYVTETDDSKQRVYPPYKYEIDAIRSKKFDPDMIKKIRTKK